MVESAPARRASIADPRTVERARLVVATIGGRYSREAGIDVDGGDAEIERWFLAATLFGTRISAAVAQRTFRMLDEAGVVSIARAGAVSWDDLVVLLDRGGYARYDFRTATRLHLLSAAVGERWGGKVAELGRTRTSYPELRDALDALPGWGPVTVQLFLRELRGVWPGAQPPLDARAVVAAQHLGLATGTAKPGAIGVLVRLAEAGGLDTRDLEGALVRLMLAHRRDMATCPGGDACSVIAERRARRPDARPVG
jgi:hypothetical protein